MAKSPRPIHGTRWNDTLNGTNNAETLYAGAGDDIINPRGGDDIADGGAGTDTVLFSGSVDDYSLRWLPDGYLEVSGADGTDKLINVEFLQYGSTTYSTRGPVARSDAFSAHENQTLSMDVLDNDQSLLTGGPLEIQQKLGGGKAAAGEVVATTADGRVHITLGADGNLVFDPGTSYDYLAFGVLHQTTFSYTVGNGTGYAATASVTLTITGTHEGPTTVYPEDKLIIHQIDNLTPGLERIGTDGWRDQFVFNFDLYKNSASFGYIYGFSRGEDKIVVINGVDPATYQLINHLPNGECLALCGCDCPPIDSEFIFTDDPGVYSSGYSGVSGIIANSLIGWDDIYVTNDPNYGGLIWA